MDTCYVRSLHVTNTIHNRHRSKKKNQSNFLLVEKQRNLLRNWEMKSLFWKQNDWIKNVFNRNCICVDIDWNGRMIDESYRSIFVYISIAGFSIKFTWLLIWKKKKNSFLRSFSSKVIRVCDIQLLMFMYERVWFEERKNVKWKSEGKYVYPNNWTKTFSLWERVENFTFYWSEACEFWFRRRK